VSFFFILTAEIAEVKFALTAERAEILEESFLITAETAEISEIGICSFFSALSDNSAVLYSIL